MNTLFKVERDNNTSIIIDLFEIATAVWATVDYGIPSSANTSTQRTVTISILVLVIATEILSTIITKTKINRMQNFKNGAEPATPKYESERIKFIELRYNTYIPLILFSIAMSTVVILSYVWSDGHDFLQINIPQDSEIITNE